MQFAVIQTEDEHGIASAHRLVFNVPGTDRWFALMQDVGATLVPREEIDALEDMMEKATKRAMLTNKNEIGIGDVSSITGAKSKGAHPGEASGPTKKEST